MALITMRKAQESDVQSLKAFLEKYSIEDSYKDPESQVMLLLEGSTLLGVCIFTLLEGYALIKGIYMIPSLRRQGFGDGLLRSTLHYIQLQHYHHVILLSTEKTSNFYKAEGLQPLQEGNPIFENLAILKDSSYEYFHCLLSEFFNRKCKGSKGRHS